LFKVRTSRLRNQEHGSYQEYTPSQDEVSRSLGVKHRSDLHAAEEGEEDVEAEDLGDGAFVVGGEFVGAEVGLIDARGVHEAEGGEHAAEGAEDDGPGFEAAFGVSD